MLQAHSDWSVPLGGAFHVAAGMSPAKYSFDVTAPPDCVNDYVVFALNIAGSVTQANLIGLNQLYRSGANPIPGLCGLGNPNVYFAYNVSTAGGTIATSPIVSMDGTKIAFVESVAGAATFHVLTWAPGGTIIAPVTPTPAEMVSITYAATANTRSSPWMDYKNDVVYVGSNNGRLYKITGVFLGTPTLVTTPPWPINIGGGNNISAPVLDRLTDNIFVGDARGRLDSVNVVSPGVIQRLPVGLAGATSAAVVDGPLLDSLSGTVFAISPNNGANAVVVEASTSSLAAPIATGLIGLGASGGTAMTIYDGAFDNKYFTSPSTGSLVLCGTGPADTSPYLYTFNFSGTTLQTPAASAVPILTSLLARCSPITEFFNPNVNPLSGGTDFFFFGMTRDCFPPSATGCVMSRPSVGGVPLPVRETGGTSAIVVDNQSTANQASSIYFTNLGGAGNAVKLTQDGLQ